MLEHIENSGELAAEALEGDTPEQMHPLVPLCQQLANKIAEYGVSVNFGGKIKLMDLKPTVEAGAAASLLVSKGVCTQDEWDSTVFELLYEMLANTLQRIEEARLQMSKPKLQVARAMPPHSAVALHGPR